MAKFLTESIKSSIISEKYVCLPEKRAVPAKNFDIPVIDLQNEYNSTSAIMKACKDTGVFLVINHGIPTELMRRAMEICDDFFKLPTEEKTIYPIESDTKNICNVFASTYNYDTEEFHHWRDCLRVVCTPLDECMEFWPQKPHNFKEVMEEYVRGVMDLRLTILEQISGGLGLHQGYLGGELSKDVALSVNHYPPSPHPDLTMGLQEHTDPTVITIMQAGNVPAFQFMKDGQWFRAKTPPDAFVVLLGSQIEVISDGKLKGLRHRAVSTSEDRYSMAFFITPTPECIVEPAPAILEANNSSPHYKSFKYKDFFNAFVGPVFGGKVTGLDDVLGELDNKSLVK